MWPSSSVSSFSPDPLTSTWYILPAELPTKRCIWLIQFSFSSIIQLSLSSIFLFLYWIHFSCPEFTFLFHSAVCFSLNLQSMFFSVLSQLSWMSVKSLNMFAIAALAFATSVHCSLILFSLWAEILTSHVRQVPYRELCAQLGFKFCWFPHCGISGKVDNLSSVYSHWLW